MKIIRQPQNRYKQQAETDGYETGIRIQRRTVYLFTSFHPGTDGKKPADGRFVYLFIRPLYQSSLPLYRTVQYIILPPHIYHQYEADEKDPWSIYWFHFKGTKAPYIAQGQDVPHTVTPSVSSRQQNRLELFEEIYTTLKSNLSVEHINYANFCFGYFLSTLLYIQQYRESGGKSEYMGTIINRSIYYMNENINKNLTVQEIASFVNYSPSYFYRKFMQEIGIAPMTYFTKMKINKAYGLLKDTDLKINQIATLLGYTDPLYFSRVFSKEAGVSPQQYRAANKK